MSKSFRHKWQKFAERYRAIRDRIKTRIVQRLNGVTLAEHHALHAQLQELHRQLEEVRRCQRETVHWLSASHGCDAHSAQLSVLQSAPPLVSVIMPVRNREECIARAIRSVQAQSWPDWELIVINDGSTDRTKSIVEGFLGDARIRLLDQNHLGVCRARNQGLADSRGALIAYLDSDNAWHEGYLETMVATFDVDPKCESAYAAQEVWNASERVAHVRGRRFDQASIAEHGSIDLNVFVHRRSLYETWGGFDASLSRLVDWELVCRYTREAPPTFVPLIGCHYAENRADSVSRNNDFHWNSQRIAVKNERHRDKPLKVLYALSNYPQLSESYIQTEIDRMRQWGVEIEVWRVYPDNTSPGETLVPTHDGPLRIAVAKFQPDVIHSHWLHVGLLVAQELKADQIPVTVRSHSFEFTEDRLRELEATPAIAGVYIFPFAAGQVGLGGKTYAMPVAYHSDWFEPCYDKDPKLVVRCGAGLPTKDIETYLHTAALCPDHRFLLAIVSCPGQEKVRQQFVELNERLGRPVDLRFDVPYVQMRQIMHRAGIYMHTTNPRDAYGMPISIAESMATGAYIIARNMPAALDYVGWSNGGFYNNAEQAAALVKATQAWSRDDWRRHVERSSQWARSRYADVDVLRPLLQQWQILAGMKTQTVAIPALPKLRVA